MRPADDPWDVVIAGGGPAGLSAALVLGRCRRRVLLCDAGTPRNAATDAMHGFLGHVGIAPAAFRERVHEELAGYPQVRFAPRAVEDATALPDGAGFAVRLDDGTRARCRKLLLATGMADDVPRVPGFAELWGRGVHGCPYCDGWELADAPLAAYGRRRHGMEIARALTAWSRDLVLCTDGPARLSAEDRRALDANGVRVIETRVARLDGHDGRLHGGHAQRGDRWIIREPQWRHAHRPTHSAGDDHGDRGDHVQRRYVAGARRYDREQIYAGSLRCPGPGGRGLH